MDTYVIPISIGDIQAVISVTAKTEESALRKFKKIISSARNGTLNVSFEEIERE